MACIGAARRRKDLLDEFGFFAGGHRKRRGIGRFDSFFDRHRLCLNRRDGLSRACVMRLGRYGLRFDSGLLGCGDTVRERMRRHGRGCHGGRGGRGGRGGGRHLDGRSDACVARGVDFDFHQVVDAEQVFESLLNGGHEAAFHLAFDKSGIGGHDEKAIRDSLWL